MILEIIINNNFLFNDDITSLNNMNKYIKSEKKAKIHPNVKKKKIYKYWRGEFTYYHFNKLSYYTKQINRTFHNQRGYIDNEINTINSIIPGFIYMNNILIHKHCFSSKYITYHFEGQCEEKNYYHVNNLKIKYESMIERIKCGIILDGWHGSSVYHEVIDCISRIIPFLNWAIINKDYYIVISKSRYKNDIGKAILNLLGFDSSRIIEKDVIVEKALIPTPFYCCGSSTPILQKFRSIIRKNLVKMNIMNGKKYILFVERTKTRVIIEMKELIKKVREEFYNYDIKIYKDTEQNNTVIFNLFYYANIVIAHHGAGLTNFIFCNKNTIVMEIKPFVKKLYEIRWGIQLNLYYCIFENGRYSLGRKRIHINVTDVVLFLQKCIKNKID